MLPKTANCICSTSPNFETSIPIICTDDSQTLQRQTNTKINQTHFINHSISFVISLEELSVEQPSVVYVKMPFVYREYVTLDYNDYKASFSFNFSWQDMEEYYASGVGSIEDETFPEDYDFD